MGAEPTLEDLNRRLAEIQDELLALDDDDFAARYELMLERDQIRAQVREAAADRDADRPTEELRAELAARKSALEELKRGMVNTAGMAGGGGGGTGAYEGPLDGMKINNAIRSAQDTDELVRRITHLEGLVRQREADDPSHRRAEIDPGGGDDTSGRAGHVQPG